MERQGSFSQAEYAGKKKQTRRDKFLAEMEQVVPWARLVERLRPFYPKGERGRPPIGLERMLRIHFLQQWYGLADGAMEDALYDSQALRGFAGIDLTVAAVPEETTILNFRHWLEQHELSQALFAEDRGDAGGARPVDAPGHDRRCHDHRRPALDQEQEQGARPGDAPDQERQSVALRDEGAYRGRCCLGGGAHGRRYRRQRSRHQPDGGGIARPGKRHLRRCRLYRSRQAARTSGPRGVLEHRDQAQHHQGIAERPGDLRPVERALAQVRAWVEHPFHIVKNLFRHKKLRYRGLAKNTAQLHTLFALANLVIVKKTLLAQSRA